jgi:hypothetical protein
MLLEKIANELRGSIPGGKAKVDALATKVAGTYLNTGENMTKQIQKLAEAEGLSDEYVKRICETSNHKVSSHLFNTNEDKNFQFDLADWQQILSPQEEKTASVYDKEPTHYKKPSVFFKKEALIGPAADMGALGIPSIIGYGVGRHMGNKTYEKEEEWEPSMAKTMLIPGYLGYSMGKGNAIEDRFIKDYNEGNKPKLQPDLYNMGKFVRSSKQTVKEAEQNPYYMKTDPTENLLDLKDTFSRAEEDTRVKLAYIQNEEQFVFQKLYSEFSSEVKDNGYFKVAQALVPFLRSETIEALTYEGISDGTISEGDLFTVEKLAEVVDETAEVIKLGQYYEKLRQEKGLYKLAHEEITEQLQTICNTLKAR